MADFDLSLVVRADASEATTAGAQVAKSVDDMSGAEKRAAGAAADLERKTAGAAAALEKQRKAAADAERAEAALALTNAKLAQAQDRLRASTDGVTMSMSRTANGARNLGQQVLDFGTQIQLGGGIARAFSSQIGQVGYAMSEMGGRAGAVGRFLAGPWGIALTLAALVLTPFVEKLFSASKAADELGDKLDKAADAADSFGAAQSLLGKIIDLTTGKLKTQNAVLVQSIKLQAAFNLEQAKANIRKAGVKLGLAGQLTLQDPTAGSTGGMGGIGGGNIDAAVRAGKLAEQQRKALVEAQKALYAAVNDSKLASSNPEAYSRAIGASLDAQIKRLDKLAVGGKLAGKNLAEAKLQLIELATAGNDQSAALQSLAVIAGGPVPDSLTPYSKPGKPKKTPKGRDGAAAAARLEEFGEDAADRIADITAQFADMPSGIAKADKAVRDLDDLIDDLSRKKPPNFAKLIEEAKAAKSVVTDSLLRPYDEFIKSQEQALTIAGLMRKGRDDEAAALRTIISLESQGVPLTQARKDAILASVQALREEARQLDILREKNQKYVDALGGIKSAVEDATQAFVRGDLGQFIKSPKKLLDAFVTLQGRKLFEGLFGDLFRELQSELDGTNIVKDAAERFARATDKAKTSIDALGNAAAKAAGQIGSEGVQAEEDIVVTGQKPEEKTATLFEKAIGGVVEQIAGLFGSPEFAKNLGTTIGKFAGQAIEGAATGQFVAGIAKSLGIKMSNTGAQIGGALGGMAASAVGLPPIVGEIVGSVLGGVIGNMIGGAKTGSANITSAYEPFTTSGTSGSVRSQAGGLGRNVQESILQIAEQLGGQIGSFAVSIGIRDGKYRVDPTGQGITKTKKGAIDFGKDGEAAAIAYAVMDAIRDGAVIGLSEAVRKALSSSDDVNKALKEALAVRDLETALGGVAGSLKRIFLDFDTLAAERVRLAKKYGLDLLAVEKLNAEDRAKLVDSTLRERIGSLQDFVDSLRFGDLFEGSAADRRAAILAEIAKVTPDAENGVEGAADKLAELYRQLTQTSRDAFGTAGPEFVGDRANALTAVERVIQMERDRVAAAQAAQQQTAAALQQNNTLTSETNDLLARNNALLGSFAAAILGINGGNTGFNDGSYITSRATDIS